MKELLFELKNNKHSLEVVLSFSDETITTIIGGNKMGLIYNSPFSFSDTHFSEVIEEYYKCKNEIPSNLK